jgi:hypothetical protein
MGADAATGMGGWVGPSESGLGGITKVVKPTGPYVSR